MKRARLLGLCGLALALQTACAVPPETAPPVFTLAPSPTAAAADGWRVYTNTRFGYQLAYPPELSLVKGPSPDAPDEVFATVDAVSFSGLGVAVDPNAGVVVGVATEVRDSQGERLQCAAEAECLAAWRAVLGQPETEVTPITAALGDGPAPGFAYEAANALYMQTFRYYARVREGQVWLISVVINNYPPAERAPIDAMLTRMLASFVFTAP